MPLSEKAMSAGVRLVLAVVLQHPVFSAAVAPSTFTLAPLSLVQLSLPLIQLKRYLLMLPYSQDLPGTCFPAGSWATPPRGSCQVHWSSSCPMQSGRSSVPQSW